MQALARRLSTAPLNPWPSRPVPVLLAITELDIGGAERALAALATGLNRGRWAPHVVALGPEAPLAAPIRAGGVPVTCLDADNRRPLRTLARLAGVIRQQRPALVQSFLFHANVATRLAALLAGPPQPWLVGGIRVAEHQRGWHRTLERLTFRLGTGAVCVSEGVRRFSQATGRLPADRLCVIPNGVDPAPFEAATTVDRSSLGVPDDAVLALYVGRLDRQKGLPILLDALARILPTRPDLHLALAGAGPERDALHALSAADPSLSARVHWLGPRPDVPALLKASDLLVLPSLWEGMPNVVLEAMASGRPVVATAVEGTSSLVLPGRTGWLVPPADPTALASALLDAAADPARRQAFGAAGHDHVLNHYTPSRVVAAYEHLWARLLGLDPATAPGSPPLAPFPAEP